MPSLKKSTTTKVFLPSTAELTDENDRVWFELKTTLLLSDYAAFTDETDPTKQAILLLSKVVVDWNLNVDGEPDTKLPITVENIDEFAGQNLSDFAYLSELIGKSLAANTKGLSTDEKKTSSLDSTAVTETISPPII